MVELEVGFGCVLFCVFYFGKWGWLWLLCSLMWWRLGWWRFEVFEVDVSGGVLGMNLIEVWWVCCDIGCNLVDCSDCWVVCGCFLGFCGVKGLRWGLLGICVDFGYDLCCFSDGLIDGLCFSSGFVIILFFVLVVV